LTHLAPGYNGTWNGLPVEALGNNFDGVASSTSRMKFESSGAPNVSPRIENIEEMTVQTSGLDASQGYGQAAMQAAQKWKFKPAQAAVPGAWILQFQFTRAGAEVAVSAAQ